MRLGVFKDKGSSLRRCWTTSMQDEASVEWRRDEREGLRPYLTRLKKELWDRVWKRESCYAKMERHEQYFSIVPQVSLTTRTWMNSLSKSDLKLFHRLRLRQSSSTTCQYCLLDDETVQHGLTDCEHWSRESRLCGITDCDAYEILHGNNIADIKNLLKFVRLTRNLK